jgi:hypothetical protein
MQAQTSIREPGTCMTLPIACLLSAASVHTSISSGKERYLEGLRPHHAPIAYGGGLGYSDLPVEVVVSDRSYCHIA